MTSTRVPLSTPRRCGLAASAWPVLVLTAGLAAAPLAHVGAGQRAAAGKPAADDTTKWRADFEARLRAEDGWLAVAGLFFLAPGANTMGSATDSRIVLPRDAAPARAGAVILREGRVWFEVTDGVEASLNGQPATSGELRPASAEANRPADVLRLGRISLMAHRSGPRLAIRLKDPESPVRTTFTGLRWFPVDPAWKVTADFVPHATPRRVTIVNVLGDELEVVSPGLVRFTAGGQAASLVAFEEGRRLWFVFTDATAGTSTYRAARMLYADPPRNGKVVLDFNRAENPPCAYNPFTTCPLPPRENRLAVAVTAGERDYPNRWQPR